jgi:hypothetical protein
METPETGTPPPPKSALTIVIQSWATPIVGVVMLILGLVGGYLARPLLASEPSTAIARSAPVEQVTPAASSSSQQELMATVVAQTRHFKGDPNAPVTIVEFGDFQ